MFVSLLNGSIDTNKPNGYICFVGTNISYLRCYETQTEGKMGKKWSKKKKIGITIVSILAAIVAVIGILFGTGVARTWVVEGAQSSYIKEVETISEEGLDKLFTENLTVENDISYFEDGNENTKLDFILPNNLNKSLPVIVNVHGGGLIGGDKSLNATQSRYFAQQGYAVVNINYTRMPDASYKQIIQEIYASLHWVENNAEGYNLDLDHVYMTGDSAGGMLVSIMAAVLNGNEELQNYYGISNPGFEVKKFALTGPMVGTKTLVDPDNVVNGVFHFALGKDIYNNEEAMDMADIYQLVDKSDYPEIFILTTKDDSAFYYQADKFDKFLNEKNIKHEYKVYESQGNELGHVFNVSYPDWEESKQANSDIISFFEA